LLTKTYQTLKSLPYKNKLILILFVFIIVSILLMIQLFFEEKIGNDHYTYARIQAKNDVIIHVMRTEPQYIHFQSINKNVTESGFNGINGGFFWEEQLLSIAVENNLPAQGAPKQYGSGWYNTKYPRGTLVYDPISAKFSIQIVNSVDEIEVTDRSHYWAQGGVSMNLSDEQNWENLIGIEALPFPNDSRLRSGMIYDQEGFVNLIVSSTHCTASEFRAAILDQVHTYHLVDGIFLDGDGSSQMLADDHQLMGDGRKVTQMIRID
jgi:hypothetical protein